MKFHMFRCGLVSRVRIAGPKKTIVQSLFILLVRDGVLRQYTQLATIVENPDIL